MALPGSLLGSVLTGRTRVVLCAGTYAVGATVTLALWSLTAPPRALVLAPSAAAVAAALHHPLADWFGSRHLQAPFNGLWAVGMLSWTCGLAASVLILWLIVPDIVVTIPPTFTAALALGQETAAARGNDLTGTALGWLAVLDGLRAMALDSLRSVVRVGWLYHLEDILMAVVAVRAILTVVHAFTISIARPR
ncbi:hypothetical protein [Paracoccus sanguinis]|uniref:Uncharacterized protein n=1 Tax=Paracoccus sanguinis TaxID=1545044 RepID=A0A1H2T6Z3_9RHOB|nr:hypothetical protein [Paracoccus sanguinis]SDW39049.1 hypothetical protein SAMN05444276_101848 [Paracoccus sanguinis]